jgi:hypothetical protein
MNFRKFTGNSLIVLGILNILNFYSPRPIPTVGISAFIFGGIFIIAGLFVRAERNPEGKIDWKRLFSVFRTNYIPKRESKVSGKKENISRNPMLAVLVIKLASERKGKLTIAQTAMDLDSPLEDTEAALDECVARGSAYMDVDQETGIARYRFPEFEERGKS